MIRMYCHNVAVKYYSCMCEILYHCDEERFLPTSFLSTLLYSCTSCVDAGKQQTNFQSQQYLSTPSCNLPLNHWTEMGNSAQLRAKESQSVLTHWSFLAGPCLGLRELLLVFSQLLLEGRIVLNTEHQMKINIVHHGIPPTPPPSPGSSVMSCPASRKWRVS